MNVDSNDKKKRFRVISGGKAERPRVARLGKTLFGNVPKSQIRVAGPV